MARLDGFRKGDQVLPGKDSGYPPPAHPRPAKPRFDRNAAPPGYDAEVWHLALLFEQYAHADKIELRAGRPIIYAELMDLVTRYEMRGRDTIGSYPQEVHSCARRLLPPSQAARCWYHWPPTDPAAQEARELTWVQMVEVIMAEFWSRWQNEHAVDHFRQYFAEYARAALRHWRSLRAIREIESRPRAPREIMRRKPSPATMSDASKEG